LGEKHTAFTASPSFTSGNSHEVTAGVFDIFAVEAIGTPAPFFRLTGAPEGVTIDPASGLMSITNSQVGTHTFTITATNTHTAAPSVTQDFTLKIQTIEETIAGGQFFDPPPTGVSDIKGFTALMIMFIITSAGLWGYILRRRFRP
jgi:hypothetical protein